MFPAYSVKTQARILVWCVQSAVRCFVTPII